MSDGGPGRSPGLGRGRGPRRRAWSCSPLGLGLFITVLWGAALLWGRASNIWLVTGTTGAAALVMAVLGCQAQVRTLLRARPVSLLWGGLVGLAMAGATYLLYPAVMAGLRVTFPALGQYLGAEVARLYQQLRTPPGPVRGLPLLALIVVAEEVVFRGLLVGGLRRSGDAVAVIGSALLYAAAQAGSGSPLLVGLALVCGLVWGTERVVCKNLLAPLLTHLVWDLLVFAVAPLA